MPDQLSDDIVQQLLQLPYDQRDRIASTLINSLHPEGEEISQHEWQFAWIDECHRRAAEVRSGAVSTIPANEVIARMREKHGG